MIKSFRSICTNGKFDANVYYTVIPISNNKTVYTNKGVTWPVELTQQLVQFSASIWQLTTIVTPLQGDPIPCSEILGSMHTFVVHIYKQSKYLYTLNNK